LAYTRANPGKLSYGHSGTGNTPHLAGEMLKQRTGLDMVHIPYKSGGQAVADCVGNQVPLAFSSVAGAQAFIKNGRLKAIGVSSAKRIVSLPDAPTFIEQGVANFAVASWVGIAAPAATPKPIVDKLNREILAVLKDPDANQRFLTLGIEAAGSTPDQFAAAIREDLEKYRRVVAEAKIKVE
jgi:tripartite-type tricarboxylate transporter receptor subunit TctC